MITSGFYNSIGGDRKYNSIQMSTLFDGIINDGVFMSIGDRLMVSPAAGMNVIVGSGRAWFNHTWTNNDAEILLNISQSEVILNRIDIVVLEINASDNVRTNSIKVIKGVPSMVPVAPNPISTELINEHLLCQIYIGAGVAAIDQANITNKIGTSSCPFITGILETVNIDTLIAQWQAQWNNWTSEQQADFEVWFTTVQTVLDANTAGNLLNLINTHTHTKVNGMTVESNVPANAKFTETTINGKTGAIGKSDITALGIPAQDSVYTHPPDHPASMITGLPSSLPANGGNSDTVDGIHITVTTVIPTTLATNTLCLVHE